MDERQAHADLPMRMLDGGLAAGIVPAKAVAHPLWKARRMGTWRTNPARSADG